MATPKRGLWYRFAGWLVRTFFFGTMGGLKVLGRENVPHDGPLILASIHLSHLDPPLLGSVCARQLRFMAKEELFKNPLFSGLIKSLGAFPIKRGGSDMSAIKLSLQWLEAGDTVLVFPEGQRGDGIALGPMQPGAAMLADRSGAQVVPVGINGPQRIMPRGGKGLKRSPTTVAFGKPFTYAEIAILENDKENRNRFTEEVRRRIEATCAEAGLLLKTDDEAILQTTSRPLRTPTSTPAP